MTDRVVFAALPVPQDVGQTVTDSLRNCLFFQGARRLIGVVCVSAAQLCVPWLQQGRWRGGGSTVCLSASVCHSEPRNSAGYRQLTDGQTVIAGLGPCGRRCACA